MFGSSNKVDILIFMSTFISLIISVSFHFLFKQIKLIHQMFSFLFTCYTMINVVNFLIWDTEQLLTLTVCGSLITDAVRPAALLPLPDVYTAMGEHLSTNFSS